MYRTIDTSTWDDPKVKQLDHSAKLVFLYLITNRHSHVSGIYYLPDVFVEHELSLSHRVLNTVWHTLSSMELAYRDGVSDVVFVRKMLFYQGRGEKNYRAAANQLGTLHKSKLIQRFMAQYPEVKRYCGDTLLDTLSDTISEVGIQDQEQDQEQEREEPSAPARAARPTRRCPADFSPDLVWAKRERPDIDVEREAANFKDCEFKTPHKDWPATWRVWVRNAKAAPGSKTPRIESESRVGAESSDYEPTPEEVNAALNSYMLREGKA